MKCAPACAGQPKQTFLLNSSERVFLCVKFGKQAISGQLSAFSFLFAIMAES
jgi:hypothetical protein